MNRFLEKGADVNARNNNGDTPLHWAARNNNSEVAEFFMSKHADVNTKNKDDWTPLHFAAARGNLNVVELILDKRDDVDAIGALTVANTLSRENSSEIASLLEERIRKNEGVTQHLNSQEEGSSLSIDAHNRPSIAQEDENSLQNDKIGLNKIGVTSGTSKPSSFINIFADTTVDTVKGVFQFISSPFKAAISKITSQKYISTVDQSVSPLEAQCYALNIIEEFEKIVEQDGLKSGVSIHRLNIDYMGMQTEIARKIMAGKFYEISGILSSHAEKACPGREVGCLGKLSSKKFGKFMIEFNKELDLIVNQSMQQILHNVDGTEEQQMSLKLQSYLSNTSIQGHLIRDKVKLIS